MSDPELQEETRLPQTLNPWEGKHAEIFADTTEELDVEGARMCAKTTLLLDKEIHHLRISPGINTFICRYTDIATKTKLKPRFETICRIRGFTDWHWNDKELCYEFSNGSKCYAFGLKAANQNERYDKIRGLDVSRVYNDQSESVPGDIGQELSGASCRQKGYKHQITFSPNPVPHNHWLAEKRRGGFPEDNSVEGKRYYRLEIYDNRYNLTPEDIARMERTYPPDHAKHGSMILGKRGPNVFGIPIFEDQFVRSLHVRSVALDDDSLLLEGLYFGKRNPVYIVAQRPYAGGLAFYGGLLGEKFSLKEFLPTVTKYRREWFDVVEPRRFRTCVPAPAQGVQTSNRFTNLSLLRTNGFMPIFRESGDANDPDVAIALIGEMGDHMQRRHNRQECFAINNDPTKWLRVTREGIEPHPFLAHACESMAVWDEHWASVSHQKHSQIHEDDEASNVIKCALNIELNFGVNNPTMEELDQRRKRDYERTLDNRDLFRTAASWLGH